MSTSEGPPYLPPEPGPPYPRQSEPSATVAEQLKKALAPVVVVGAAVLKFGAILLKLKAFTLVGSVLLSLFVYAQRFGWQFALGFVVLLLVHEVGHVVLLRARGIDAGWPVLIPFMGAFVSMKSAPKSAYDEALSGIAGPVFGTVGAFVTLLLAQGLDSPLLRVLAYVGFFLNLFNLFPVLPLDGGRTVAALSPKIWGFGLLGLLAYEVWRPSPIIPFILLIGGFELYRRWKGRDTEASRAYYALTFAQRRTIGLSYVGLVVIILWAMHTYPLPPT